ncbi:hypothetical protein LTS12_025661 [Elasticomyces elasticus]|nr:hypothetical protein LTS12_025661 [Elasticomyces elasticus]
MAANTLISVIDQATESSEPASTQVFGTTELLEHILIHVPARDVLLSQRVSQQWQAVTTGSLSLQRLLLFVGDAAEPAQWAKEHLGASTSQRAWFWDGNVMRVKLASPYAMLYGSHRVPVCFNVNDLLAKLFGASGKASPYNGDDLILLSSTIDLGTYSLHDSATRPEASWRRMLLLGPGVVGDVVDMNMTGLAVCESVYTQVSSAAESAELDGCIRLGKLWSAATKAQHIQDQARRRALEIKEQARRRELEELRDQELADCLSKMRELGKDQRWLGKQGLKTKVFIESLSRNK